jgi:hypothetical protein
LPMVFAGASSADACSSALTSGRGGVEVGIVVPP